jgi:hypothetical protein
MTISSQGDTLQVLAGEKVKAGANPEIKEELGSRTITWVWVEATGGQFVGQRKGYVSSGALGPENTQVEMSPGFQRFAEKVGIGDFADACYVQAILSATNPAYLFALAWAQSGNQWSLTDVQTNDTEEASAIGVFQFTRVTWEMLLSDPDASDLQPDDIKFPIAQCIVAAILAKKSADLLKGLITDRSLSAVDLFLAHLFADDKSFGSNATAKVLQAERDDQNQSCIGVINQIYPADAQRTAFLKRNARIFNEDGSASIKQALKICAEKLDAGFDEVAKLARTIEDSEECKASALEVLESSIPSNPTDPIGGRISERGTSEGGAVIQSQQKATRNLPISPQLHDVLEYAGRKTGLNVEVYSGGQPTTGPRRTGSHRHDIGPGLMGAADLFMRDGKTNRILDSDNLADRPRMAAFMEESAAAGATGIGHAPGYMGSDRTHIGGGSEAVWGTGNSRTGAPDWVIKAFQRGRTRALPPSKVADGLLRMREAAHTATPPPTQVEEEERSADNVNTLAGVRRQFADEVRDPRVRRLLAASTAAEVGGQGSKAAQYYIESVFNRAAARKKSLEKTVTDSEYYPDTTLNKLGSVAGAAQQARINEIIERVMAGSNASNFATGNESGHVHSGGAEVTRDLGYRKERFVREISDLPWIRQMKAAAARG